MQRPAWSDESHELDSAGTEPPSYLGGMSQLLNYLAAKEQIFIRFSLFDFKVRNPDKHNKQYDS